VNGLVGRLGAGAAAIFRQVAQLFGYWHVFFESGTYIGILARIFKNWHNNPGKWHDYRSQV
jgi:hypothetical protein